MSNLDQQIIALKTGQLHRFSDWPNRDIPRVAAGVYSIWNDQDVLIYVGMAGRGKTVESLRSALEQGKKTGLIERLNSHASGLRSGDQFCVYVQDLLVLPTLTSKDIERVIARELSLDRLVRDYIRKNLSYRYVTAEDGDSAMAIERKIINGDLGEYPILNPPSEMR